MMRQERRESGGGGGGAGCMLGYRGIVSGLIRGDSLLVCFGVSGTMCGIGYRSLN